MGGTGSGKDSFFNILLGRRKSTSGTFFVNNDVLVQSKPWITGLGLGQKLPIAHFHFKGKPRLGTVEKLLKETPAKIMSILGITPLFCKNLSALSTWQWVRVVLANAVTQGQPFIAVDGHLFTVLDGKQSEHLRLLLKQLQHEYGFGIIINTDNAGVARAMADDVIVMNRGYMEQFGSADDVYRSPANKFVLEMFSDAPVNVFQGD